MCRGSRVLVALIVLLIGWNSSSAQQAKKTSSQHVPTQWILNGYSNGVKGMGVAPYSKFNPEKAWKEALSKGVDDLNANHSMIVYSYGKKVGRGPWRFESNYAIRSFLDTTQVSVVDSARWKGRAFVLIEPTNAVPDSTIYPNQKYRTLEKSTFSSSGISRADEGWLHSTGATPRIDSNWFMSFSKAKQDALRRLAEYLATQVSTETYSKNNITMQYSSFSSMFAFQRIKVLSRSFTPDSVKVEIAVKPHEVKKLME
jgi:hypothetical protein